MTATHRRHHSPMIPLWVGVFALILGFPLVALATGYGGDHHDGAGTGSPHQGSSSMGHGKGNYGASMKGGHGKGGERHGFGHGPHQSASKFIDHILKFKEGMAITDDQVAKLHTIKTDFKKTKIKMKADMKLTSVDLHNLLRDDQGSLNDVEAKLKSLYDTKASLYLASVKAGRDARAVLTDEQRSRMKAVHDRIKAYGGSSMGKKGHPGGYSHHGKEKQS